VTRSGLITRSALSRIVSGVGCAKAPSRITRKTSSENAKTIRHSSGLRRSSIGRLLLDGNIR
jgi:hypothetical protein